MPGLNSEIRTINSVSDVLGGDEIRVAVMRVARDNYCSTRSGISSRSKKARKIKLKKQKLS